MPIVEARQLCKFYRAGPAEVRAVDDVSLAVPAGSPEVVLADEPTSNLDEESGRAVIDLLRQAHGEGQTVIASSHDPRLAAVATRVCALQAGRLRAVTDAPG